MISRDPAPYAWWLAARSAGVVAFLLISTAVVLGLFNASGISRRPGQKRTLVKVHEQVALAGLVAIAAHGVFLLGDPWLKPGITGISLPFTMTYRPLWTGLGIVAGYLAAVLGLTFYMRKRIGARRWRSVHRATVLAYVLTVAHSFGSGTDGAALWFRVMVILSIVPIAAMLVLRYRPRPRRPLPARGAGGPTPGRSPPVPAPSAHKAG